MYQSFIFFSLIFLFFSSCEGKRTIRTAKDITPGHIAEVELDWKYGANDIRLQTMNITKELMDRWFLRTGEYRKGDIPSSQNRPRITITEVDNLTDQFISIEMVREIFESVAINDGRFSVIVGNEKDEDELDLKMSKFSHHKKYKHSQDKPKEGHAKAPHLLAKIRITKASTEQPKYILEHYRMTVNLYDLETQEAIDSAYDLFEKKVQR